MPLCPRPPKVVARKGQKKVRYQTLGQKSQVTILACGCATGQIIPPFMIFAVKQISPLWTPDKVSGSRFAVSDSGWVDQELFNFWLTDHFLPNVPSRRPVLLLLDGHSSNFEPYSIQFAREHQIVIFCLPLHSTHECQPLDTSFFRSLKSHWQNSVHKFYQDNSGKSVSKLNFCSVLKLGRNKNVCKEKKKKLKKFRESVKHWRNIQLRVHLGDYVKGRSALLLRALIIDEYQCCVCVGFYEEDEGTGRTWLQCTCSR